MVLLQHVYNLTLSSLYFVISDSSSPPAQYKDIDQGGLKCNGNPGGSLTFGETGGRLCADTGDVASSLQSLPPFTVSSIGQGESKDLLKLVGFFLSGVRER